MHAIIHKWPGQCPWVVKYDYLQAASIVYPSLAVELHSVLNSACLADFQTTFCFSSISYVCFETMSSLAELLNQDSSRAHTVPASWDIFGFRIFSQKLSVAFVWIRFSPGDIVLDLRPKYIGNTWVNWPPLVLLHFHFDSILKWRF